jgi:hypothetical protein
MKGKNVLVKLNIKYKGTEMGEARKQGMAADCL